MNRAIEYGELLGRDGNRGPTAAPQNLYLTADIDEQGHRDAWVAIAVATDEQWLALRESIVRVIREVRPDVVLCPDPTAVFFGDGYYNHRDRKSVV